MDSSTAVVMETENTVLKDDQIIEQKEDCIFKEHGLDFMTDTDWTRDKDSHLEQEREKKIFDLWLACHRPEDITKEVGTDQIHVLKTVKRSTENNEIIKTHNDFTPKYYSIWSFHKATNKFRYPGNIPPEIIENLVYYYTEPFDIVFDPFAGGGPTIDVCQKWLRRYFVSDIKPFPARQHEIRKWDITQGLPPELPVNKVQLAFLDPPYWKQAEGKYGKDPRNFANMPLDEFNNKLSSLITNLAEKLRPSSYIALIIQPTQWKAPGKKFTDHVFDVIRSVGLPVDMRISCPYSTQQCTPQMMQWAKKDKQLLVISRELIIWKVV